MSPKETESKSTGKESKLQVIKREDNGDFIVKTENGNICTIEDTYAETFAHMVTIHSEIWEEAKPPFFYTRIS